MEEKGMREEGHGREQERIYLRRLFLVLMS